VAQTHLPSGRVWANCAWLACAAIAFNLTRAAGTLASALHAKATTGTKRTQLINVPARLACSARRLTLHLPTSWPGQSVWQQLLRASRHGPPRAQVKSKRCRPLACLAARSSQLADVATRQTIPPTGARSG
jgi:hypothetical protein